jgi:hypothetical protein
MNKITIPALLLGVVMIAGAFAFMPVQEASTVHTGATTTLAADAITAAKIADNAIIAANIATDAIGASEIAANAIGAAEIGADAITAAKIADNAILAVNIATDAIGALEVADAVEPLNNVLTAAATDLNAAGLDASCGGDDPFLVHYAAHGVAGDILHIDLTDNAGAEYTVTFQTATLFTSGTVAGAGGATVEIAGNDDDSAIKAVVTVQCLGSGTAAVAVD